MVQLSNRVATGPILAISRATRTRQRWHDVVLAAVAVATIVILFIALAIT
jgi:hypothetical protein